MIKSLAYFPSQCAKNSVPVMNAFLDCVVARGIQTQEHSMVADAAVIWSVLWHGRMSNNQTVYQHYRQQGKPVFIIDVGALYRGHTWKIALNNITAQGYYGHKERLNPDRPRQLGISLAVPVVHRSEILIAAQHSKSLQVDNLSSMESWIIETVGKLRQVTDRPITVRPHPRCSLDLNLLPKDIKLELPNRLTDTYDSFDMHFDCHAVVNYNSGPGTQAAISGCRPLVDSSSLAYPVSVEFENIEKPYSVDRDQWLIEICHTEYTLTEIQCGLWLDRLAPAL